MGQMDSEVDPTDTVRALGHSPLTVNAQALAGYVVPCAELPDEVCHAAGHRSDEQFYWTHPRILPVVRNRLIGYDPMLAAHDVVASPAMVGRRDFHREPPLAGSFTATHRKSIPSGTARRSPSIRKDP